MIPPWIPRTKVDGSWLFTGRPYIREQLEREGLRYVCPKPDQDAEIWVRRRWALIARFEHWYSRNEWWLYHFAARHGIVQLKEEGGYFADGRLANPKYWFRRRGAPYFGRAPYFHSQPRLFEEAPAQGNQALWYRKIDLPFGIQLLISWPVAGLSADWRAQRKKWGVKRTRWQYVGTMDITIRLGVRWILIVIPRYG